MKGDPGMACFHVDVCSPEVARQSHRLPCCWPAISPSFYNLFISEGVQVADCVWVTETPHQVIN